MDFDAFLLGLRVALHFGTFIVIASYRPPEDAKYKPWVSFLATCIAGSSLSLFVINITEWSPPVVATAYDMIATGLIACFFALAVISKGNVSNMLPRRAWPR